LSAADLLLANLAATLFLTGLAWYMQLVHLPLAAEAGLRAQRKRNSLLMAGPMLIEAVTLLSLWRLLWLTAVPLVVVWLVTFGLYVPKYGQAIRTFDAQTARALVRIHWIRTICWTVRAGMVLWIVEDHLHI
jgi:hypothetical protein